MEYDSQLRNLGRAFPFVFVEHCLKWGEKVGRRAKSVAGFMYDQNSEIKLESTTPDCKQAWGDGMCP